MTAALVMVLGGSALLLAPGWAYDPRSREQTRSGPVGVTARARRPRRSKPPASPGPLSPVPRALAAGSVAVIVLVVAGGLVGVLLGIAAVGFVWQWTGRRETRRAQETRERLAADLPHAVDLFAALLRAGRAPAAAAETVGSVVAGPAGDVLAGVARRDRAGLDPYAVWKPLTEAEGTAVLGAAMLRSLDSGARVVDLGDRVAEELRRELRSAARAHARTVGVRATAPLAACFLPALISIGVVPFVVSLVLPLLRGA